MMTKFNQELYARIKAKKNEPLSSIGQWRVRVIEKDVVEKGSSTPIPEEGWAASLAISIEEVTLHPKKRQTGDKGKEKVGASVWADAGTAIARL